MTALIDFLKHKYMNAALCLLGMLYVSSCTSTLQSSKVISQLNAKYCYPDVSYQEDSAYASVVDINSFLNSDSLLKYQYSIHDIKLANALGLLVLLNEMTVVKKAIQKENNLENRIRYLEKRQLILNRLLVAISTVASIAAELDCEGERADQIASFMDGKEAQFNKNMTALSIGLGAVAGVSTTVLNSGTSYYILGIGGGISSGLLALVTLYPNRTLKFTHKRNLLADIWLGRENSEYYPFFIWYVFNDSTFNTTEDNIICHTLKKGWEKFGSLGKAESKQRQKQIDLFFGQGGDYTAENLHSRADMINQLQSAIRLINQDLQSLIIAISK